MANINYSVGLKVNQTDLAAIKASLQEIANMASADLMPSSDLRVAADHAERLRLALDKAYSPRLGSTNLSAFTQELNNQQLSLGEIRDSFANIGQERVFDQMNNGLLRTNLHLKESNELLNSLGTTMANTLRWTFTSAIVNTFTSAVSNAYNYVRRLDRSLNNIRIVTGKNAEDMHSFAIEANNAAKAMGSATLEYTNASLIYYQAGYGDEEVKARTDATIKAANVAKTSAQEMSEYLMSVWNGYQATAANTELFVDKLSKVAATTASDLEELATGMSKVASVANTLGIDFDQLNAMLATIISVTRQAPESAGVALKTIFARLEDLSLGNTDEEGVDFGGVDTELRKLGISIADENNKLRDMGIVIDEIGQKWQTWTKEEKAAIAVAMAGTRQYSNLFALFENWDMYTETVRTSATAMGTLQKQQDIYMEGVEASTMQLQAAWDKLFQRISDGTSVKIFAKIFTGALDNIAEVVEALGGGFGALITGANTLAVLFSGPLATNLGNLISQYRSLQTSRNSMQDIQAYANSLRQSANDETNPETSEYLLKNADLYDRIVSVRQLLTNDQIKSVKATQDRLTNLTNELGVLKQLRDFERDRLKIADKATNKKELYGQKTTEAKSRLEQLKNLAGALGTDGLAATREYYNKGQVSNEDWFEVLAKVKEERALLFKEFSELLTQTLNDENFNLFGSDQADIISTQWASLAKNKNLLIDPKQQLDKNEEVRESFNQFFNQQVEAYVQKFLTQIKDTEKGQSRESYDSQITTRESILADEQRNIEALTEQVELTKQIQQGINGMALASQGVVAAFSIINTLMDDTLTKTEKIENSIYSVSSLAPAIGTLVSSGNPMIGAAIGSLVSSLINGITGLWAGVSKKAEAEIVELNKKADSFKEKMLDLNRTIHSLTLDDDLKTEFNDLARGVSDYGENISLSAEEFKRYNEIVNQLISYSDKIVLGYNSEGKAIIEKNNAIEKTIELLKEQKKIEEDQFDLDDYEKNEIKRLKELEASRSKERDLYMQDKVTNDLDQMRGRLMALFESGNAYSETDKNNFDAFNSFLLNNYKDNYSQAFVDSDSFKGLIDRLRPLMQQAGGELAELENQYSDLAIENLRKKYVQSLEIFNTQFDEKLKDTNKLAVLRLQDLKDSFVDLKDLGLENSFIAYINEAKISPENYGSFINDMNLLYDQIVSVMNGGNSRVANAAKQLDSLKNLNVEQYKQTIEKMMAEALPAEQRVLEFLFKVKFDNDALSLDIDEQLNNLQQRVDEKLANKGVGIDIRTDFQTHDVSELSKLTGMINYDNIVDEESRDLEVERVTQLVWLNQQLIQGYDTLNSAIADVNAGKQLDAETTEKLVKLDQELGNIRDQSADRFLERLIQVREAVETQNIAIKDMMAEFETKNLISIDFDTENAEQDIENFFEAHSAFEVEVRTDIESNVENALNELNAIDEAAKNIGENFIVTADDIEKVVDAFPSVLDGLEFLEDGTIRINQEILDAAINGTQAEVNATIEGEKQKLQAMITVYEARAEIYRRIIEASEKLANEEYTNDKEKAQLKAKLDAATTDLHKNNLEIRAINAQKEAGKEIEALATIGDQSAVTAQTMVSNLNSAWETMVQNAVNAANTIADAFAAAAKGEKTNAAFQAIGLLGGTTNTERKTVKDVGGDYQSAKQSSPEIDALQNYQKQLDEARAGLKNTEDDINSFKKAIVQLTAKQNQVNAGLKNVASGGGYSGKKSGGSGGAEKELKDQRDIFHDINIELDLLEKNLKRLQDQEDKLYGQSYLDNLETQLNYYERFNELLLEKQRIQEQDLAIKKEALLNQGVLFNDYGQILNYNDIVNNEGMKEAMDAYEDTLYDVAEKTKDELLSVQDEIWDIMLKKFTFQVDIEIEVDEARKKWKDFLDEMSNYAKDNIIDPLTANIDLFSQLIEEDSAIEHLTNKINEIISELDKGDEGLFAGREAEGLAQLEKYQNELMDSLKDINKIQKEIEEAWLNFIDKAKDNFEDHVQQFERLTDILSHQKNLIDLLYGDKSFKLFDQMYQVQHENNKGQLDFYRQQIIYWQVLRDTFEEGTDEWIKANENLQKTQSELNKLVEKSIKNIIDQYNNAVNSIFDAIDKRVTKGLGIDNVGEQWQRALYLQDKYLDNTEKIIEQQKLEDKFLDAINNTDNIKNQEKLKQVQEYLLKGLREKDKLTQYDVDRAQLLYEIALKEMALEDAKNAKTSMRLVRDTQGNWNYEYTADQDKINAAEDDLLNTKSDLYKLDKDAYTANLQEMYDIYSEWQEKVRAVYADTTLDAEEKERKKVEYASYYGQLIDEITQQNQEIRVNITASAFDAINQVYMKDIENVTGMTQQEIEMMKNMTQQFADNYFMFEQSVKNNWDEIHGKTNDTMGEILGIWTSSIQEMITGFSESDTSFKNICLEVYNKLEQATDEYKERLAELEQAAGNNFTNISNSINEVNNETDILKTTTEELISAFEQEAVTISELMDQYAMMVEEYAAIKEAAMDAASAAHDYSEAMREAAAHSVGSGSTFSGKLPSSGGYSPSGSGSSGSGSSGGSSGGGGSKNTSSSSAKSYFTYQVIGRYGTEFPVSSAKLTVLASSASAAKSQVEQNVKNAIKKEYPSGTSELGGWSLKLVSQQLEKDWYASQGLTSMYNKIYGYAKGGLITEAKAQGEDTIIAAQYGERVLTQNQNKAFEEFVYNLIPNLLATLKSFRLPQINIPAYNTESVVAEGQTFQIENINFPNARDKNEILEALSNLSGIASQYINTKRR